MPERRKRVAIGGVGYAGLSAAQMLLDTGFKGEILVFEDRRRPGGRALSAKTLVPDKIVDFGPEFFGRNHRRVLALAARYGIEMRQMEDYEGPFSPLLVGCGLSAETCLALDHEMAKAAEVLVEMAETICLDKPWEGEQAAAFDRLSLQDWLQGQRMSEQAKNAFRVQVVANHGVALDRLSLLAFLLIIKAHGTAEYLPDTEVYRMAGGAQALALKMAEALGGHINFDEGIQRIENQADHVLLTTSRGLTVSADYLILTTPPSTWEQMEWAPNRPAEYSIQMGQNVKVFLVLEGHQEFRCGLSPYSVQQDGLLQLLWDSTEGQEHLGNQMVITCFSGGPQAEALCELGSAELRDCVLRELSDCVPALKDRLKAVHIKAWPKNPRTRCGYSAPAPGQMLVNYRALNEGWGRVRFASEACARQIAFVNGSVTSGQNTALDVLEAMGESTSGFERHYS